MQDLIHGNHTIELRNSTLILTLSGEFNEYGVRAYVDDVKKLVAELDGKPFLVLVDNTLLKGATPEAYEESEHYNRWLSQQKLIAKATVYPSHMLAYIDSERVPSKKNIQYKTFTNVKEANEWLSRFK